MIDRFFNFFETWLVPLFLGGLTLAALIRPFLPQEVDAALRALVGM